jgi:hypothetical protein
LACSTQALARRADERWQVELLGDERSELPPRAVGRDPPIEALAVLVGDRTGQHVRDLDAPARPGVHAADRGQGEARLLLVHGRPDVALVVHVCRQGQVIDRR